MTKSIKKVEETAPVTKRKVAGPIMSLTELKKLQAKEKLTTKSATIRFLDSKGHTRSEISKTMNIRYQHVRNVLVESVQTNS